MSILEKLADSTEPTSPTSASSPHILLIVDGFPKVLGGGERVVLRLAALLPEYGFRVSILTLSLVADSGFDPATAPCPVYLLPLTNTYGPQALRGMFALGSFLRREHVRLVQTFFESSDLWAGAVVRISSSAKLIWSRRDMGILRGKKHQWAYRTLRQLPHAVIAVSERVAEHVRTVDGIPAARIHVVHNGLDLQVSPRLAGRRVGSDAVITTIGNVRKVKGHDILIKAAKQVLAHFPLVTFTIAGEVLEPAFYSDLETEIAREGMERRIRFLGKVTALHELLQNADLFVLPSRSEGFSNALVEAMAAGLPCVATDVGGNAEAIEQGTSGLIVQPEAPGELAAALLQLLAEPDFAQSLGRAARHRAESSFSSESMLKKTVAVYRTLLRSS